MTPLIMNVVAAALKMTLQNPSIANKIKNRWISADLLLQAIQRSNSFPTGFDIDRARLNNALGKLSHLQEMDRIDGTNQSGIFRLKYSKRLFYFIGTPKEQVAYPHLNASWTKLVMEYGNGVSFRSTRSSQIPLAEDNLNNQPNTSDSEPESTNQFEPQSKKRELQPRP